MSAHEQRVRSRIASSHELAALREVEAKLALLTHAARILPAITAPNAAQERVRLRNLLEAGQAPVARFDYPGPQRSLFGARFVDQLRSSVCGLPGQSLYEAKLEELDLDLAMLAALGDSRRLRPLSARRFGSGEERVPTSLGLERLCDYARRIALQEAPPVEARSVPASARDGSPSLASLVGKLATYVGLQVSVRVEPNLAAAAATGDRTVYIADRAFGVREAVRLAAHEVLGHLTAAANGRAQPLRLIEWGTCGSFADQEGVALCIEDELGLLDAGRMRSLAGRVLATCAMHAGASFAENALGLHRDYGYCATEAITLCERAHRGGGVARDVGYLSGYLRVRAALDGGETTLDELRMGRVGVSALPLLRQLQDAGLVRPSVYTPSTTHSLEAVLSGASSQRLSAAAWVHGVARAV